MPDTLDWRKASFTDNGTCVELADIDSHTVGMRNSNRLSDGELHLTQVQVREFVRGIKTGEGDFLFG